MADVALLERARGSALDGVVGLLADVPALFPDALERGDTSVLSRLQRLFAQVRDTLLLIDRPATALIADEALAVLDAVAGDTLVKRPASRPEDVVRALLGAHDALLDAVASSAALAHPGDAEDVATPALAVLNELRSLRGEPFLSHALLIALDIPVDVPANGDAASTDDAGTRDTALAGAVRGARPRIMRLLVDWFRAANDERQQAVTVATRELSAELAALARQAIDAGVARNERDLLLAAMRVSRAVGDGRLDGSGAVRRLFALVERWLVQRWCNPDKTPNATPESTIDLLRNVLFYVAIAEPETADTTGAPTDPCVKEAQALDARYRLDRLRRVALQALHGEAGARIPTYRIRVDIAARVRAELTPIADWLGQGGVALDDRAIAPHIARLADLPPAFELLGANDCRQRLERMRELLAGDAQSMLVESSRELVARELLQLHDALDRLVSSSSRGRIGPSLRADDEEGALSRRLERVAAPERNAALNDRLLVTANAALLAEARRRLADCESALEGLGAGTLIMPGTGVAERLQRIARALDIVPRPEASALLDRLADIVGWLPQRPDERLCTALARLVVSIDGCLGQITTARTSSQALDDAEGALAAVERELPASRLLDRDTLTSSSDARSLAPAEGVGDARAMTEQALDAFSAIGALLADDRPDIDSLAMQFGVLRRLARERGHDQLATVALSVGRRLEWMAAHGSSGETLALDPVRDAHVALPQLIERLSLDRDDAPGAVRDVETLIDALEEPLDERLSGRRGEPQDDPLDNTLRGVFVDECSEHLDALESELGNALASAGEHPVAWSGNERWLRVLHTLTGSARTVDANAIVSLVAPMQRASLARQRSGDAFTRDELAVFADGVRAMRQALQAFEHGQAGPPLDADLSARFDAMARIRRVDQRTASLQEIFAEEAGELLDRLDALADEALPAETRRQRALSLLHTLKGSARVAASPRLADAAHEAEARLQASDEAVTPAALQQLRRELSDCLAAPVPGPISDDDATLADPPPGAEETVVSNVADADAAMASTRVRDTDWERLTDLSQDIAASQARLAAQLRRLRDASGELDVAAQRWRRLPAAASLLETEAARELLDDLQSVRASLADCLRAVDLEQRRGARAGLALQQDLVRARRVRFDTARSRLQRTLDDAASSVDRRAALQVDGGAITLDSALQARLLPALEHLVRNAVVHGIESADERRSAGKDPVGRVGVTASVDGMEFVVRVGDDGRGLAGVSGSAAALDADSVLERICTPGFSTLSTVSGVGGRGLGLAAARERIVDLGGRLVLLASDGGAVFEIRVPQRVPVQQVLLVRAGELIGVPVGVVACIESLPDDESPDRAAPRLADLLGTSEPTSDPADADADPDPAQSQRLLRFSATVGCERVRVDAIIGYRELIVQPLDVQLASLGRYTGVASLADGQRAFVIDPRQLADRQAAVSPRTATQTPRPQRPLALVADDSPTLRAWTRDTLETLGFRTRIVRDGREALDALDELAERPPAVMVLDIDMPRIDGYGVLQTLQRSGEVRFPVVVMTSRSSARDREAASEYGAAAFIAKPASGEQLAETLFRLGLLPE